MWCGLLVRLPSSTNREYSPATRPTRVESCPPAWPLAERPSWADRLLDWLGQGWHTASPRIADDTDASPPPDVTPLSAVRLEFVGCLDGIPTRQATDLALRIRRARSPRELWHLRSEVFNVVSCHTDQKHAKAQLSRLNRHFPARATRSGFGAFDGTPQAHRRP